MLYTDLMLPRERVQRALARRKTDRVPLDFWATPEVWMALKSYFGVKNEEELLRILQIDMREFRPDYIGPPCEKLADGSYYEPLGTHRRTISNKYNTYEEYAGFPLAYAKTAEDLESYRWFSADHYDFQGLSAKIGEAHKTYCIKLWLGGFFELAWALRGYEQFLMDMVLIPEIPHFILGKIVDFYLEYLDRAMASAAEKIDLVYAYDDIASQRGMLMSTQMWEDFVKPCHVRINAKIHHYGKKVLYHSCGNIYKKEILDGLLDMGVDILNPIQMCGDMTLEQLKDEYGDKFCFHGGIDIQKVLPFYSGKDLRAEVKRVAQTLGREGGFILTSTHCIQNDTPVSNIIAMFEEAAGLKL